MTRRIFAVVLVALLAGCASTAGSSRDPLEPMNRAVFRFNDFFDENLYKPVAKGYVAVVPSPIRTGIHNVLANIDDLVICLNNVLQGKVPEAASDFMRFVINSTFGLGGLIDVASEARLEKHNEDFGQTLGWWGVPSGPYVVIPFWGPSNFRDGPALIVTYKTYPLTPAAKEAYPGHWVATLNGVRTVSLIDVRANLLQTTNLLDDAALDRYRFVRDAYTQRRRNLVYDGQPPLEPEDEVDDELSTDVEKK